MIGVLRLNQSEASIRASDQSEARGATADKHQSINTSLHSAPDNTLLWTIEPVSKKSAGCQNLASIEIVNIKL